MTMRRGRGSLQVTMAGFGRRASTEKRGGSEGAVGEVGVGGSDERLVRLSKRDFLRTVGDNRLGSRGRN
jgi:hypothetical protein